MNSGNGPSYQQSIIFSPVNPSTPLYNEVHYTVKLKADIQSLATVGGTIIMMMFLRFIF